MLICRELPRSSSSRRTPGLTAEHSKNGPDYLFDEHDFAGNESLTIDITQVDLAATSEELDERWRKQVKYEFLVLKLKGYDDADGRRRLRRKYERT